MQAHQPATLKTENKVAFPVVPVHTKISIHWIQLEMKGWLTLDSWDGVANHYSWPKLEIFLLIVNAFGFLIQTKLEIL